MGGGTTLGYGLGVDLGTTFTAAATVVDGRLDVVSLGDRAPEVPSAVHLREDGHWLVGEPALRRGVGEPDRLAREFKRRLGDSIPLVLGGHPVPAEALTGRLLRWVVEEVTQRHGERPQRIVVTRPAVWGPFRREMLDHALLLADVGRVETAPEPVAAALHYASTQRVAVGGTVAIYDLGGGTFDAAVLRHAEGGFELLGTPTGLEHLGGADFDEAVFRHVVDALGDAVAGLDPDDPDVTEALARLRRECTDAKEHLTVDTEAQVQVTLPGIRRGVRLTRGEFEEMIRPSIAETVASLRRALASAGVDPEDLSAVVLVGGSARVPLVSQMLGHDLGRPPTLSPAPKHAVALGAALLARGGRSGPTTGSARPGSASRRPGAPAGAPTPTATPSAARVPTVGDRVPPAGDPATAAVDPGTAPSPRDVTAAAPRRAATADDTAGATATPRSGGRSRLRAALAALSVLALLLAFVVPLLRPPDGQQPFVVADLDGAGAAAAGAPAPGMSATLWLADIPVREGLRATVDGSTVRVADPGFPSAGALGGLMIGPVRATVGEGQESTYLLVFRDQFLGVGALVLLAMFVLAYAESLLRGVRRRRRARGADVLGMAVMGLLAGAVLALAGWMTSGLLAVDGGGILAAGVLVCSTGAGVCGVLLAARRGRTGSRTGPNRP